MSCLVQVKTFILP